MVSESNIKDSSKEDETSSFRSMKGAALSSARDVERTTRRNFLEVLDWRIFRLNISRPEGGQAGAPDMHLLLLRSIVVSSALGLRA